MKWESKFLFMEVTNEFHRDGNIQGSKWIGFIKEKESTKTLA